MPKLIFLPGIPVFLIFILVFIVTGITFYTYSRIQGKTSRLLFFLRLGAIMVLLFILLQPSFSIMKEKREKSNLIFLVDNSPSMKIGDEKHKSRLDRLKEFFRIQKGFINALAKNNNLKFYSFSDRLKEITFEEIDNLKIDGSETNYSEALEDVKEKVSPKSINGIFILSDGIDNRQEDTLNLLEDFLCPIYTISPGEEKSIKDININLKNIPETAYLDKDLKINFIIKYSGQKGKYVPVIFKEDKTELKRENFLVHHGENNLSLDFIPRKAGLHHYSLYVPVEKDEAVSENNEEEFYMEVKKNKVYILFLTGRPSLEYKFLHRYFLSEPNIKTTFLVSKNGMNHTVYAGDFFQLEENEGKNAFPNKKEELFEYDLVIFEDFNLKRVPSYSLAWFKEFLTERGGGILMLGGKNSFRKDSSSELNLEEISPVVFQTKEPFWNDSKFIPELTREGKVHPVSQLNTDSKRNSEIWAQLPLLEGYNIVTEAKPGAQVLAVYPGDKNKIIVAAQMYGRGKSMAIMVDDLWQWNFLMVGIGKASEYYESFINRIVSWLTSAKMGDSLNLETDKISYSFNDKVSLIASVYKQDFSSTGSFEIVGWIQGSKKAEKEIIKFSPLNENMNLFRAEYKPSFPGEFEIEIEAKDGEKTIGRTKRKIFIKKNLAEWNRIDLDENFLKEISGRSKGRFYDISEKSFQENIYKLNENLKNQTNNIKVFYQFNLWDNIVVFCLFIIFLAAEWYIRKKNGLA